MSMCLDTEVPALALTPIDQMKMTDRMSKDSVLLLPTQSVNGHFTFDSKIFADKLKPGKYRIVTSLYGWRFDLFTSAQRSDLASLEAPFLSGEATASATIAFVCAGCNKK